MDILKVIRVLSIGGIPAIRRGYSADNARTITEQFNDSFPQSRERSEG